MACSSPPPASESVSDSVGTLSIPNEVPEIRTVSMRLQWIPQYQFAGYIVAKVKGYYEEAGLDVTINIGSPDFVPLPLVASGADTFGSTGADTILLARTRGIDVVALATLFQTSPVGFMVHSDAGIQTPQDFVGKHVAVSYGDNVETEYRALLAATDVNREQINEVPFQVNLAPFLNRRVDVWPVYITDQPNLARQQGATVDLILARDYGVMLMGDVLFTTADFAQQNPNTTRAFVTATLRGWHDALTDVEGTVAIVADYNPQLHIEHLRYEATETIKLIQSGAGATCPGWNDDTAWNSEQDILIELGLLEQPVPLQEAIKHDFVAAYYESQGISCTEQ
ncbi:MAG: ABC transporter substrate-binding protein [Chloroflexaceae bacterium]|nr:ABC transporter substrate-binding protein [Chloroflexaceae bacterium]